TVLFASLSLAACLAIGAGGRAAAPPPRAALRAGAAAVDVTPLQFPVNMPGGFNENLATKAHDPMHVRALVLEGSGTAIPLVLADSRGVPRELTDEAKLLVSRRCPRRPENVLVSATHTHSGPPAGVTDGRPAEVAYRKRLLGGMVEAVV